MFGHCYRLADMLPSTKECIEDLFGAGVDLQRSNKNPWKAGTIDTLHHLQSFWVRLDRDQWPKLQVTPQDFTNTRGTPIRRRQNIGSMGALSNVSKIYRLATMKKHRGLGLQFKGQIVQYHCTCLLNEWLSQIDFCR